jgi:L-amino acid N-acyltransferase YncA
MIRNATLEDIPFLLPMGEEFHKESRCSHTVYDSSRVADLLTMLILEETGIAIVNEENGKITGGIGAHVYYQYWGWSKGSIDLVVFLTKEARGGLTVMKLIKEYIRQAKEKGAEDIMLGVSSGIDDNMIDKLYKRIGFEPVGTLYSYKL